MFIICFISQWTERSKHGLFIFPPKKTLIWRRHCSIGQLCCSMTSKRFLESSSCMKFFSAEHSLNQPKATHFCIRSTNLSNRSISVHLFLFTRFHFKVIRKSLYKGSKERHGSTLGVHLQTCPLRESTVHSIFIWL